MKIIKEIFGRVWALWGLLSFIVTMLLVIIFYLPCFLLKEPYAARLHRRVSRVWMAVYLNLIGCPLKTSGENHFVKNKNYVIVCNHNSLMDVPVTTPFMPNANKTIAKKAFAWAPVFGWIYILGSVLVDRKSDKSRRQSYEKMKAVLNSGLDMVIYPEGTRNRTEKPLKSFYDGAFRLSLDTQKPIIPVLIFNTRKVLPPHKPFFMLPNKLSMHFLSPVEPGKMTVSELKEKVFRIMWDYYEANAPSAGK